MPDRGHRRPFAQAVTWRRIAEEARARFGKLKPIRVRSFWPILPALTVAAATTAAVPAVEALLIWRTRRPAVPGPHHQDGILPGGCDTPDADTPLPLLWLGDSLASGVGADHRDAAFPRRAAALFGSMDGRSVHLTCLATPGAKAADVLKHQVPTAVALLQADSVVVVTVGSNDVGNLTRPRRFRREYAAILDELSNTGATVITVGLPNMGAATVMAQPLRAIAGWAGRRADRQVQRLAAARGAHYVDINLTPPSGMKSLVYLAADGWHPNNDTYHLWAHGFATTLISVLALGTRSKP